MSAPDFPGVFVERAPSTLQIRIHTVCVVGVEPIGPHGVDIDTVLDANGVPYVPRNRISARLRDAALIVLNSAGSDDTDVVTARELFGRAFESGPARRLVQVGAAVWPSAAQATIAAALQASGDRYTGGRTLLRERIIEAMTVRIGQTRIGSDGTPAPGSLRYVRGIRPGIVLEAGLRWREPPKQHHLRFLARTALALTQIGEGETDNLGRVTCSLDGDFDNTVACAFGRSSDA